MSKFDTQLSTMVDGIQALTNLVNSQNQQIGVINQTVRAIDARLGNVENLSQEHNDRLTHLEEDQFVNIIQADTIKIAAQNRVYTLLEIERDKRGGVVDESIPVYRHYFSKFVGRLHVDARHAGLEGPRIYATPRKNYQALLNYIAEWVPMRGVKGQMKYYDNLEADRQNKRRAA